MKRVITSLVSLCLAACLAFPAGALDYTCLLYTSDAADE